MSELSIDLNWDLSDKDFVPGVFFILIQKICLIINYISA
jgi:hypothetical protein